MMDSHAEGRQSVTFTGCGADDLMTVPEVATFLRLTKKGVYSLVERRKIPFVRVSNRLRFLREDVLRWLSENRVSVVE